MKGLRVVDMTVQNPPRRTPYRVSLRVKVGECNCTLCGCPSETFQGCEGVERIVRTKSHQTIKPDGRLGRKLVRMAKELAQKSFSHQPEQVMCEGCD